jgi:hypothetical protein
MGKDESRGLRQYNPGFANGLGNAQLRKNGLAATANEFTANTMSRVGAGFEDSGRHPSIAQTDAQAQSGEPTADYRYGFFGHSLTQRSQSTSSGILRHL